LSRRQTTAVQAWLSTRAPRAVRFETAGITADSSGLEVRLLNLTLGTVAVSYRTESVHGAAPPEAQVIMIGRLSDLEAKKALTRRLAGIGLQEEAPQTRCHATTTEGK
jgi:hypothetical protein